MSKRPRRHHARAAGGFTLVEAIASIIVLATVGSVAAQIIVTASDSYAKSATGAELHGELSVTLDRMMRECRSIEQDAGSSEPVPAITAFGASGVSYNSGSAITLSGSNVTLTESGGPAAVLIGDISAFSLRAFDEAGAELPGPLVGPACHAIRQIEASITATRGGVSRTLRSRVFLRCTAVGAGPTGS